jgi:hypothetical protein
MAGAFVIAHATKASPAAIPRPVLCIVSSLLLQAGVDGWRVLQNETLVWPWNSGLRIYNLTCS